MFTVSKISSLTLCGVDMVESHIDSLINFPGADLFWDLPGSKTDRREVSAVVEEHRLERHFGVGNWV